MSPSPRPGPSTASKPASEPPADPAIETAAHRTAAMASAHPDPAPIFGITERIRPWAEDLIALLARIALAAVFWRSGQTKIEGLALDLVDGRWQLGWPHLAPAAIELFRDDYRLPLIPPEPAALLAATAEHLLPLLLLAGLGTRLAASGLLAMTAVIQLLVYPGAWPVHATWAALLLGLMLHGGGRLSLDTAVRRLRQRRRDPASAWPASTGPRAPR